MMVIVLLLPTLQTLVMDRLSSTHLGITQMEIIRGYERSLQTSHWLYLRHFCCQFLKVFFISPPPPFCCLRMVTNRTTSVELVRDPEECREAALRQYDPEKAFHNDCDWLTCTTLKIQNSRMHLPLLTHVFFCLFFISGIFSCLLNQSNACFDIWKY